MEDIDYKYHTSPDLLKLMIEQAGGMEAVLLFCQTHHVIVDRGADWMYYCWIDNHQGCFSCDMDALSALIVGIINFKKEKKN